MGPFQRDWQSLASDQCHQGRKREEYLGHPLILHKTKLGPERLLISQNQKTKRNVDAFSDSHHLLLPTQHHSLSPRVILNPVSETHKFSEPTSGPTWPLTTLIAVSSEIYKIYSLCHTTTNVFIHNLTYFSCLSLSMFCKFFKDM